ncbi:MAG TPA: sugar transferase [Kineosporiaceae bacterium]|nr:sugar transferase [Kineosporiaceae bacterium]
MSTDAAEARRLLTGTMPEAGQALPITTPPAITRLPRPDVSDEDPKVFLEQYRRQAITFDAIAAALAAAIGLVFRFGFEVSGGYVLLTAAVPAIWLVVVALQRGYEFRYLGTGPDEYRRTAAASLVLFTVLAVGSYVGRAELSRAYVLVTVPGTVLLALAFRHMLRGRIYRARVRGRGLQKVLVVGRADAVVAVIEKLDHEPQHGLVAVGACVPPVGPQLSHVHGVPVVGDPNQILEAVDELRAHVVAVVSHPDLSGHALRRLGWALEERNVELVVSPGIIEVAGPRLSIRPVAGLSLLHLERPAISGGRMITKGVFDRFVGLLLLALAWPVLAVIALAIKLTSPGPVLFRQTRIGIDGREFTMLKYRSMVVDAEALRKDLLSRDDGNGVLFKMKQDPRVTRVGSVIRRLSLDELPQLWNVVRGDMSLVGPRPPLPEEVAGYSHDATRRLRVRPGMTGLWQVSGRSDLSWEESLRLDLRYVDNWTLALDLAILWRTLRAVIQGAGAY